jgi:hypothetical protein
VPGQPEPGRTGLIRDRDRPWQRPDPRLDIAVIGGQPAFEQLSVRPSRPHATTDRACTSSPTLVAFALTGASHICGSTGQDPLLPGNPRSHVARPQPGNLHTV